MTPETALQLADWRRQNAALYARVREQADPAAAHALWRDGRDQMMRSHPQSPLPAGDPMRVSGVPYWPYDPALRWTVPVEPVSRPQRLVIDTGPDGVTRLSRSAGSRSGIPSAGAWRCGGWISTAAACSCARDATAGTTSYGGGRYLLDTAKGADLGSAGQSLVVDLNFHVPPVLPLRQPLGLPARAARQRHRRAHQGGGAADPARLTLSCNFPSVSALFLASESFQEGGK